MSLGMPKIRYVKTTAQSLLGYAIPIPKDAEMEMLNLISETKKLRKEYDNLNRKYNLKRAIRIQGKAHKKDVSKSSKLDIFGADKTQKEFASLGEKMATILVSFAYLWDFFCKKESVSVSSETILLKYYKILNDFKNDYFGKNFNVDFNNSKLNTTTGFDKESVISKMQLAKVNEQISEIKVSSGYKNFVNLFSNCPDVEGNPSTYTDFVLKVYDKLNGVDCDERFAEANHAVSYALEDAKNKLIQQNRETMVHINSTLSNLKDITRLRNDLNRDTNLIKDYINKLTPLVNSVEERTVQAEFAKTQMSFNNFAERLKRVDDEILDAKSALKYFDNATYGDLNDRGVEAPTKRLVISVKREAICLVKNIIGGNDAKTIMKELECITEKVKLAESSVRVYLQSKHYANTYYANTNGSVTTYSLYQTTTPSSVKVDNAQLTIQNIYTWYDVSNRERANNPVLGFVLKISELGNWTFTKEYNAAVKKVRKYCKKVHSYQEALNEAEVSLENLGKQISYYNSSSFKILKRASLVGQAVSTLATVITALGILFG